MTPYRHVLESAPLFFKISIFRNIKLKKKKPVGLGVGSGVNRAEIKKLSFKSERFRNIKLKEKKPVGVGVGSGVNRAKIKN